MTKSIIFLDFDGVLCDSSKEAYILSRYAFYDIDVHNPIDNDNYFSFRNNIYLVNNSRQYYYLMLTLKDFSSYSSDFIQTKFNLFISKGNTELSQNFNKKFLEKRKDLISNDFNFWNGLDTPTLFLKKLKNLIINNQNCTFAILSTKNKIALERKLKFWSVNINSDLIFDKADLENITKGQFISDFMNTHKEYSNAILIDDNEKNINSCANIENLKAFLTSWGYTKPQKTKFDEQFILNIIKERL